MSRQNKLEEAARSVPVLTAVRPPLCGGPGTAMRVAALVVCFAPPIGAAQILGLESPTCFVSDQAGDYFISNINGDPEARDNNGFITKVNSQGKVTHLKFIQGGVDNVPLHAPKGMAIDGEILYVADLDQLKGFHKTTGKLLVTISFPPPPSSHHTVSLTDVAVGPNGLLYVSDQGTNTIYRVETLAHHNVSFLIHDDRLAGPRGIAVHPETGHVIAVSWDKGKIFDISPEGRLTELESNGFLTGRFQNLSGVDFDRWGNMYVSDLSKGKIWRMTRDGKFRVIAEYLPAPAHIGIDRTNNIILVPYQYDNAAEMNGLETPTVGTGKEGKRTLADYRFMAPPPRTPTTSPQPGATGSK